MNDENGWIAGHDHLNDADEHLSSDQMDHYVRNFLTEQERDWAERHLAACDACLQLFMSAVEPVEDEAVDDGSLREPSITMPDMELLEQRVVTQLIGELTPDDQHLEQFSATTIVVQERPYRRGSWLQHPVTHYTIAASITLLLLGSGTFASFSQKLAQHELELNVQEPQPAIGIPLDKQTESWSDKMVSQTGSWLDGLQAIRFK
ncbi:MAG: hypothetical protein ACQEXQ_26105 [Bacillota bacterium]